MSDRLNYLAVPCAVVGTVGAGIASWMGFAFTKIGSAVSFSHGLGFGAVMSGTSFVASKLFQKMGLDQKIAYPLSFVTGIGTAYGASVAAASLGIIAVPITIQGAIILAVSAIAFNVLLSLAEMAVICGGAGLCAGQ